MIYAHMIYLIYLLTISYCWIDVCSEYQEDLNNHTPTIKKTSCNQAINYTTLYLKIN